MVDAGKEAAKGLDLLLRETSDELRPEASFLLP